MFYELTQNNSGGYFDVDDRICHRLFIEADSANGANEKAEELGCYWEGVYKGFDCPCCGDRWYMCNENDVLAYDKFANIEEYAQYIANNYGWTTPDVRIYYKDGTVKEIFTERK